VESRPGTGKSALALGLFLLLAVTFFGRALAFDRDVYAGDLSIFEAPRDRFVVASLGAGEGIPRWAPGIYGGAHALGAQELGLLYPPNVVLAVLATERARALGIVLHLLLAAFGVRALARKLGAEPWGATLAGVVFAFGGVLLATHIVLVYVRSAGWLPWALLGLLEASEAKTLGEAFARRRVPLATLGLLGMYLAGDPLGCVVALLSAFALVLATGGAGPTARLLPNLLLAGILTGLLGAVQLLPAARAAAESARTGGYTYDFATRWSLWPPELVGLTVPFAFGSEGDPSSLWWIGPGDLRSWAETCYVGPVVVALALAGLTRVRRDRLARAGLVLALVFLPIALGRFTPLYRLLYEIPGVAVFRYPAKLFVPVALGLALLAASGLRALLERDERARRVVLSALVGLGAVALLGSNLLTAKAASLGESIEAHAREIAATAAPEKALALSFIEGEKAVEALAKRLAHVAFVAAGALALLLTKKKIRLGAALLVLVAVDLGVALRPAIVLAPRDVVDVAPRVAKVLAELAVKDGSPARVYATPDAKAPTRDESRAADAGGYLALDSVEGLCPDSGTGEGVLAQGGFYSSSPLRTDAVAAKAATLRTEGRIGPSREAVLLGARYVFASEAEVASFGETARPVASIGGRVLLELPEAPAWATLHETARPVADLQGALDGLSSAFDPRRDVLVEGPVPGLTGGEPGRARLDGRFGLHGFAVAVETPRPSVLVVRESFARGWTAEVDGVATPILPADGRFRAVLLPAGAKRVVFAYEAPGGRLGFLVSALTAIALAIGWSLYAPRLSSRA
jgi:hypothetical protein